MHYNWAGAGGGGHGGLQCSTGHGTHSLRGGCDKNPLAIHPVKIDEY